MEDNEEKSFILLPPVSDSLRHDAIAKNVFIDALEDKELIVLWIRVMERE